MSRKLAIRHYCQHFTTSGRHDVGAGKGPRKCRTCGGAIRTMTGVYGVFVWRGDGRYPLENAITTRLTERAADAYCERDESYVTRWIVVDD